MSEVPIFYGLHGGTTSDRWAFPKEYTGKIPLSEYDITSHAAEILQTKVNPSFRFIDLMAFGKSKYRKLDAILSEANPRFVVDVHGYTSTDNGYIGDFFVVDEHLFKLGWMILLSRGLLEKCMPDSKSDWLKSVHLCNREEREIGIYLYDKNPSEHNAVGRRCVRRNIPYVGFEFYNDFHDGMTEFADSAAAFLQAVAGEVDGS